MSDPQTVSTKKQVLPPALDVVRIKRSGLKKYVDLNTFKIKSCIEMLLRSNPISYEKPAKYIQDRCQKINCLIYSHLTQFMGFNFLISGKQRPGMGIMNSRHH